MANSLVLKLTCLVFMCMVMGAPLAQAAISCGQVQSALIGCISFLRSGGTPSAACCNGVKSLNNAAKTTPDRQAACECLKTAAGSISGLSPANAAGLPGKCGVNVPYKISTSTNCKNVK
uniref:Non-specific lipid-transfer protein n=1 Tax=Fagus sylvatica TaxID=28930 RepID=A0A2N9I2C6_FAGSY